jgi:hypothetical protein
MIYAIQERVWMYRTVIDKWIKSMYIPWAAAIGCPNIVLLDLGPAHAKTSNIDQTTKFEGHV